MIRKPINAILASGALKLQGVENQLNIDKELVTNLSIPDFELEEKQEQLSKAEKRVNKKLNLLDGDLEDLFRKVIKDSRRRLEDDVDETISDIKRVVNDKNRFAGWDSVIASINEKSVDLNTRKLKRTISDMSDTAKSGIDRCIRDFSDELIELFDRYIPDIDANDFVNGMQQKVSFDIEDRDLFSEAPDEEEETGFVDSVLNFFGEVVDGATWGLAGVLGNALTHGESVRKLSKSLDDYRNSFDPDPYLNKIMDNKARILQMIHEAIIEDLVFPMKEQLDDILKKSDDKEQRLIVAKQSVENLQKEKLLINEQLADIKSVS